MLASDLMYWAKTVFNTFQKMYHVLNYGFYVPFIGDITVGYIVFGIGLITVVTVKIALFMIK